MHNSDLLPPLSQVCHRFAPPIEAEILSRQGKIGADSGVPHLSAREGGAQKEI